jgi:cytochrome c-type biogenesis protein CcmH
MTFWIAVGVLTLAVLAAVVLPILRARAAARRAADYDIEVYRDQLKEVERNHKRGLIGEQELEAAKAEIGRRILDADQRRQTAASEGTGASRRTVQAAAVLTAIALPAGALAIYMYQGNPGLDSAPFASRNLPEGAQTATTGRGGGAMGGGQRTAQAGGQQAGGVQQPSDAQGQDKSLAQAEADLAARLKRNPDDVDGWVLLGRTRLSMQRYPAAVEAFEQAVQRAPDRAQVQAFYGEALVMANGGTVVPKAQEAFEKVREQYPNDPRSRFYLALAELQAGNPEDALERWKQLVADAQPGAPYLQAVAQQMERAERQLGIEPGSTFAEVEPEGAPQTAQAGQGGQPGQSSQSARGGGQQLGPTRERAEAGGGQGDGPGNPSREQVEAAQNMSAEDRQQMIRGMVERLAGKLEEDPKDAQGWQRLVRSYSVLGEGEKATRALADGLAAFEGNEAVRRQLKVAAQRQGVAMPEGVSAPSADTAGSGSADGTPGGGGSGGQAGAAPQLSQSQREQMLQQMAQGLSNQLEKNPDDLEGWMRLGQTYLSMDKPEEAVDAYAKAKELAPDNPQVLLYHARALRQEAGTQTERTVEIVRRVLEMQPDNPEALWFAAMAELREGDKDEAREMFDKAIQQLPPDTPQTAELRKRADRMLERN